MKKDGSPLSIDSSRMGHMGPKRHQNLSKPGQVYIAPLAWPMESSIKEPRLRPRILLPQACYFLKLGLVLGFRV